MHRPVLAYTQHRLFPGPFSYSLRQEAENERESSLYTESGGLDWAGRPVYTGSNKPQGDVSRLAISGPVLGVVGHGSRFST